MKLRKSLSFALLGLSLTFFSARAGLAQLQPIQPQEPAWLTQMFSEGWERVQEGVLQRHSEEGNTETFLYGEEGLRWDARKLEVRLSFFQSKYDAHPSAELARLIDTLKAELIKSDERLKTGEVETPSDEQMADCTISYGANPTAGPLSGASAPGVTASASAYFHASCGQLGNALAYAYGQATLGTVMTTKTQQDPVESVNDSSWVDRSATVSAPGSVNCYSQAVARATSSQLNISYEVSKDNYSCPSAPPQLNVSISGTSYLYLDSYTQCDYATWNATASGGVPGYTYDWYIGGVYQASGSSFSKRYCRTNSSVTVQAIARDTASQSASAYFTTDIYYDSYTCSSGCACAQYPETAGPTSDANTTPLQPVCY